MARFSLHGGHCDFLRNRKTERIAEDPLAERLGAAGPQLRLLVVYEPGQSTDASSRVSSIC